MIKSEIIKLKVSSATKQHYSNLGYDLTQKEIYLKINDLRLSSTQRVDVICDICGCDCNISYAKYNKNVENNGLFSCKKCYYKKCHERFTNNNPSLNPECLSKKKETSIKNYGVDHPSKSEEIKNKISETNIRKYGVKCIFELTDLIKDGMIKKYNVEHPLQSSIIKDRMINTLISTYGVDNISKIDSVKCKKIQTCLLRYGVKHHSQLKDISKKQIASYKMNHFLKYGVEHPMQVKDTFIERMKNSFKLKKYKDTDLFYQGSYELDFLNYYDNLKIINIINNGPSIRYKMEETDSNHTYHSDFFIKELNLIIEIKSSFIYELYNYKNLMKEKYCKLLGYNFIFIIDKDYSELDEYLRKIINI